MSKREPIFGLDLDGSALDYVSGLRDAIAASKSISPEDALRLMPAPTNYDFSDWHAVIGNEFKKYHTEAVTNGLYARLKAFDNASDVLWRLSDEGIHIRVITSRFVRHGQNSIVIASTGESLDINNIPYRDIVFTAHKTDIYADFYLEDSPANIISLRENDGDVIIYDAPYNQDLDGDRAYNWMDVYGLVKKRMELYV